MMTIGKARYIMGTICPGSAFQRYDFITTTANGQITKLEPSPGQRVRGLAGEGTNSQTLQVVSSGRVTVYFEGEFYLKGFDENAKFTLLGDAFIDHRGLIVPHGPPSAKIGIVTRLPEQTDNGGFGVGFIIGIDFRPGAVVPNEFGTEEVPQAASPEEDTFDEI